MKKHITWLCLLGLLLTGCQSAPVQETVANTTETIVETAPETAPLDTIPAQDFNGYAYRILATQNNYDRVCVAELTGEQVNDAVWTANNAVIERYNIALSHILLNDYTNVSEITHSIEAGEDAMDLVIAHDCTVGNLSLQGYCHNLYDIDTIDLDNPWWPHFTTEALTLNGKMYLISNYMGYNGLRGTKNMYFNKGAAQRVGLEDPYTLVRERKWTLDKLISMTTDVYEDTNGNGTTESTDFYGFAFTGLFYGWLENFGIEAYQKNADATALTLHVQTDQMTTLFDKLHGWLYGGQRGIYFKPSHSGLGNEDSYPYIFAGGNAVFTYGSLYVLLNSLQDSDVDYGFLPMPLIDDTQDDYYGVVYEEPMFIPVSVQDTQKTGVLTEAMSAAGYTYILPAYKEVALKNRYALDEDAADMLDIIFANRYYSFSYTYGGASGFQGILNSILKDSSGNLVSFYAANEKQQQKRIDDIMEAFDCP